MRLEKIIREIEEQIKADKERAKGHEQQAKYFNDRVEELEQAQKVLKDSLATKAKPATSKKRK